jgi:hypothetical protein
VADLGAYCGFVDEQGRSMSWLQRVDSIAVNGVHGLVISAGFVRLQMLRVQRTYDLPITRRSLTRVENGKRPRLESSILFYGRCGTLEMALSSKDAEFRGTVSSLRLHSLDHVDSWKFSREWCSKLSELWKSTAEAASYIYLVNPSGVLIQG